MNLRLHHLNVNILLDHAKYKKLSYSDPIMTWKNQNKLILN